MENINSIIEKVQKLLALANSDNENEAKAAASKASALLMKYNLEMQQVQDKILDYGEMKVVEIPQLKWHQNYIVDIMQKYFFVRVIFSRRWEDEKHRVVRSIRFVGTKENCKIAAYVFAYLNDVYPRLWWNYKDDQYRRGNKLYKHHRDSYFKGLTVGIYHILEQTKFRVEQEMGLVVKEDPKLNEYVDNLTKGKTHQTSQKEHYDDVFEQGVEDGKKVQLRKPIEKDQNEAEVLFITNGDK